MLRFKQFLKEMPNRLDDVGDSEEYNKSRHVGHTPPGPRDHDEEHGDMDDDHTLISRKYVSANVPADDPDNKPHTYYASHAEHGGAKLSGHTKGDNHDILKVNNVSRDPESSVSGPDFYKEILHAGHHKQIESDDDQTAGGESIWKRLHRDHTVRVTRHDKDGNEIKMHHGSDWDKNYEGKEGEESSFRAELK